MSFHSESNIISNPSNGERKPWNKPHGAYDFERNGNPVSPLGGWEWDPRKGDWIAKHIPLIDGVHATWADRNR